MSLFHKGIRTGSFIEQMQGLVRLCSAKKINLRPGTTPCTDTKATIFLPWLPNDATEKDFNKFFNYAAHEQAHFHGASDPTQMSRNKTRHMIQNAVDDCRVERLQELEYPGLKQYRVPFIRDIMEEFLGKEIAGTGKDDLPRFVHALTCVLINNVRMKELGMDRDLATMQVHPDLQEAYEKFIADLETDVHESQTMDDALKIGDKIFDRMKAFLEDEMKNQTPPPPPPPPPQQEQDDEGEEDQSDPGRASSSSEDGEAQDPESGQSVSDDSADEGSEESGRNLSESEEIDEKEQPDSGVLGSEKTEQQRAPERAEEGERELDADDETSTQDDNQAGADLDDDHDQGGSSPQGSEIDLSSDAGKEYEDENGESSPEGSTEDEGDTDSAAPQEGGLEGTSQADSDGTDPSSDESPMGERDPAKKTEQRNSSEDDDSGDPEPAEEAQEPKDEPDPLEEHEKARQRWEQQIREAVEEALDDIEENMDPDSTMEKVRKEIEDIGSRADAPYMVDPAVKDQIILNREGSLAEAEEYRKQGLEILGTAGFRMTRLFIDQSKPKYLMNRRHGRFDMRSFVADSTDRRTDVYQERIGATIDKAAVSLVIDNSGSMRAVNKIHTAYQVLSGLLMYLSRANIPTEAVGFTGDFCEREDYRDVPMTLSIVKRFEESYSGKVLQRCVPPTEMNSTPDLDALRWVVPRLWSRPEKKKILLLIGDGLSEIGPLPLNMKLARSYREYIQLCKMAGIYVFGFGIVTDLSPVFGDDCITVNGMNMGEEIVRKLTALLNKPAKPRAAA